jgi:hypothetical protein
MTHYMEALDGRKIPSIITICEWCGDRSTLVLGIDVVMAESGVHPPYDLICRACEKDPSRRIFKSQQRWMKSIFYPDTRFYMEINVKEQQAQPPQWVQEAIREEEIRDPQRALRRRLSAPPLGTILPTEERVSAK